MKRVNYKLQKFQKKKKKGPVRKCLSSQCVYAIYIKTIFSRYRFSIPYSFTLQKGHFPFKIFLISFPSKRIREVTRQILRVSFLYRRVANSDNRSWKKMENHFQNFFTFFTLYSLYNGRMMCLSFLFPFLIDHRYENYLFSNEKKKKGNRSSIILIFEKLIKLLRTLIIGDIGPIFLLFILFKRFESRNTLNTCLQNVFK